MFGYAVDAAIVNRVLPQSVSGGYFSKWLEIQKEYLAAVEEGFADIDIRHLRLFDEEMVGIERLRILGETLYGEDDPLSRLSEGRPFRVEESADDVVLVIGVPLAEKGDVDVVRHGNEMVVTVGPYRRAIVLPDSLARRHVRRAQLKEGELRITFGLDD